MLVLRFNVLCASSANSAYSAARHAAPDNYNQLLADAAGEFTDANRLCVGVYVLVRD